MTKPLSKLLGENRGRLLIVLMSSALLLPLAACERTTSTTTSTSPASSAASTASITSTTTTTPTTSPVATTVGKEVDDTIISTRVRSALVADEQIKSLDIKVQTRHGEVVLSGFADNQTQIDRGVAVAKATEGVTTVTNQMSLKQGTQTIGNKIDDTVITAQVKAALLADTTLKTRDISVVTRKGQVQLSGFVDDEVQGNKAAEVARHVDGVVDVVNHTVKK